MKVVSASQMKEIDRKSIYLAGISDNLLMGFAGKSVFDHIVKYWENVKNPAIICGSGNNGGDGFVTAYFLHNFGYDVKIYFLKGNSISSSTETYYNLCKNCDLNIEEIEHNNFQLKDHDLLVDAIFGIGFYGTVKGLFQDLICKINKSDIPVLSIDIPSGLSSEGLISKENIVVATSTLTIGLPKYNLLLTPGKKFTGSLYVLNIGFPEKYLNSVEFKTSLINSNFCKQTLIKKESVDLNKYSKGSILCVGGFKGMEGAIILTAKSALKMGAGTVTILSEKSSISKIVGKIPEIMTSSIIVDEKCDKIIQKSLPGRSYDILVIGPGLSRTESAFFLFKNILEEIKEVGVKKVVIDADGLFHLKRYLEEVKDIKFEYVITPHLGEASLLLNEKIEKDDVYLMDVVKKLTNLTMATVLLKGNSTVISNGTLNFINNTGNNKLATAGSGDVLSGMIAALCLKNSSIVEASVIAAYIHGITADIFRKQYPYSNMLASDIIENIPSAIEKIVESLE